MIETDNVPVTPTIPNQSTFKRLTPHQRSAIVAEVASGRTQTDVAKAFGVSSQTVWTLVNAVRKQTDTPALARSQQNWRDSVVAKSQVAIDAGLDHDADPYKRATLGTLVMKGVGEWAGDNQVSVFVTHVSQLPADMRSEYVSSDDALEIEATPIGLPDHNQ